MKKTYKILKEVLKGIFIFLLTYVLMGIIYIVFTYI